MASGGESIVKIPRADQLANPDRWLPLPEANPQGPRSTYLPDHVLLIVRANEKVKTDEISDRVGAIILRIAIAMLSEQGRKQRRLSQPQFEKMHGVPQAWIQQGESFARAVADSGLVGIISLLASLPKFHLNMLYENPSYLEMLRNMIPASNVPSSNEERMAMLLYSESFKPMRQAYEESVGPGYSDAYFSLHVNLARCKQLATSPSAEANQTQNMMEIWNRLVGQGLGL